MGRDNKTLTQSRQGGQPRCEDQVWQGKKKAMAKTFRPYFSQLHTPDLKERKKRLPPILLGGALDLAGGALLAELGDVLGDGGLPELVVSDGVLDLLALLLGDGVLVLLGVLGGVDGLSSVLGTLLPHPEGGLAAADLGVAVLGATLLVDGLVGLHGELLELLLLGRSDLEVLAELLHQLSVDVLAEEGSRLVDGGVTGVVALADVLLEVVVHRTGLVAQAVRDALARLRQSSGSGQGDEAGDDGELHCEGSR